LGIESLVFPEMDIVEISDGVLYHDGVHGRASTVGKFPDIKRLVCLLSWVMGLISGLFLFFAYCGIDQAEA
jgi:hypothetical protein